MKQKEIPEWAPTELVNYYNDLKNSKDDYDINGLSKSCVAERLIFDDRMESIWPKLHKRWSKIGLSEDGVGGFLFNTIWQSWKVANGIKMTRAEKRLIHKDVKKAAENLIEKMEKAGLYMYDPLPIIIYDVAEIADDYASDQSDGLISHINLSNAVQTAFIVSIGKHFKSLFKGPLYEILSTIANVTVGPETSELTPVKVRNRLRRKV